MKKQEQAGVDNTVKTTINISKKLWEDFSIKVIKEKGGRKKNDVIAELLRQYLE
jgi:metal-responsive CopG/Arc/MetJ family transcriptional regulator